MFRPVLIRCEKAYFKVTLEAETEGDLFVIVQTGLKGSEVRDLPQSDASFLSLPFGLWLGQLLRSSPMSLLQDDSTYWEDQSKAINAQCKLLASGHALGRAFIVENIVVTLASSPGDFVVDEKAANSVISAFLALSQASCPLATIPLSIRHLYEASVALRHKMMGAQPIEDFRSMVNTGVFLKCALRFLSRKEGSSQFVQTWKGLMMGYPNEPNTPRDLLQSFQYLQGNE